MRREGYDIAEICLNGHVVNSMALTSPNHNKKFCDDCGAETIQKCPNCGDIIKGTYHYPNIVPIGLGFDAPKFCDNCGSQFPWTKTQLSVARELIELAENLTTDEKSDLNLNIQELVKGSPKVPIAQIKVKRLLTKVDRGISDRLQEALSEIISQTIQDNIWK